MSAKMSEVQHLIGWALLIYSTLLMSQVSAILRSKKVSCKPNPCRNGGACRIVHNSVHCDCPAKWNGPFCQTKDGEETCTPETCMNGGKCIPHPWKESLCQCTEGYTGEYCHINVDDCQNKPCKNGGTCTDDVHGFKCKCEDPFYGTICEREKNMCSPTTCLNGGTCKQAFDSVGCVCAPGFKGAKCEINVDDCHFDPITCKNGGTCVDKANGFECMCPPPYKGKQCTIRMSVLSYFVAGKRNQNLKESKDKADSDS